MAIKRKIAGSRKQYSLFYLSFALNTLIYLLLAFLERYTWKPGVVVSLRPSFFECIQMVTKLGAGMLGHACKSVLIHSPAPSACKKKKIACKKEGNQTRQTNHHKAYHFLLFWRICFLPFCMQSFSFLPTTSHPWHVLHTFCSSESVLGHHTLLCSLLLVFTMPFQSFIHFILHYFFSFLLQISKNRQQQKKENRCCC